MKNTAIYKILVLLAVPVLYYVVFSGFNASVVSGVEPQNISTSFLTPSPNNGKNFINCIFNDGRWPDDPQWIGRHIYLGRYNDLHFNTVHIYDVINGGPNGDQNGNVYYGEFLPTLRGDQIDNTNHLLDSAGYKNLKILFDRCKISKLCYAQRLVYEVGTGSTSINNGFCYTGGGGEYTTDSGRTVKHGTDPVQQYPDGYWLATGIYENLQHGDLTTFNLQFADLGTWYLKPMMRIKQSDYNPNDQRPVVAIVTYNFSNNRIDSTIIRVRHFGNNGTYLGNYVDIFYDGQIQLPIQVSGDTTWGHNGLNEGVNRLYYWDWPANCRVDFKVYWCGQVEVWFDKMTVDDAYGNDLFNGVHDFRIQQEVSNFADNPNLYSFFADEIVYSQLPACHYVDSVMKHYNPNARLHIACTNVLNTIGLRNNSIGLPVMFQTIHPYSVNPDAHEFYGLLPYQFINADPKFPDWWKSTSNNDYNQQLQEHCLGDKNAVTSEEFYFNPNNNNRYLPPPQGSLVYQIAKSRQMIDDYSPGTKMIMQPQIQMWAYTVNDGAQFRGNREPTNEEIQVQAMLSIAHGADGFNCGVGNVSRHIYEVNNSKTRCAVFPLTNSCPTLMHQQLLPE